MRNVAVATPEIKLDGFLKWAGVAATGGEAKELVVSGAVEVNGRVELRRGRKLRPGDRVQVRGEILAVRGTRD